MLNLYKIHNRPEKLDYFDLYASPLDKLKSIITHKVEDFEPIMHIIKKLPREACRHAHWFMPGRWIEAEPHILTSPWHSYYYAKNVIKGRWIEAESNIRTHPGFAFWYANDIIKGRWHEAEPYIRKDESIWSQYRQKLC